MWLSALARQGYLIHSNLYSASHKGGQIEIYTVYEYIHSCKILPWDLFSGFNKMFICTIRKLSRLGKTCLGSMFVPSVSSLEVTAWCRPRCNKWTQQPACCLSCSSSEHNRLEFSCAALPSLLFSYSFYQYFCACSYLGVLMSLHERHCSFQNSLIVSLKKVFWHGRPLCFQ